MQITDQDLDEIVSVSETARIYDVSPVTLWRWERQGLFPQRIRFGPRRSGYWKSQLKKKQRELSTTP